MLLLDKIILESKCEKSLETSSFLVDKNFEFLFYLHLFCETLPELKIVSDFLQKSKSDLSSSCSLINALISRLNEYRNNIKKFNILIEGVNLTTKNNNIKSLKAPKLISMEKLLANLAYYLIAKISELRKIPNKNYLQLIIFYLVIDKMVSELNRRFNINSSILKVISSLNPKK